VKIALSGLVTKYEYAHLVGLNTAPPYQFNSATSSSMKFAGWMPSDLFK
jgi:hypothetical protein